SSPTQVPLQAGQTLQVVVSQSDGGVRLQVVNQPVTTATNNAALSGAVLDTVTLAPEAIVLTAPTSTPSIVPALTNALTPQQAVAVANAAQAAATQQTGLSALFADLGAAALISQLPPKLQQAVAQVLAQQPSLDTNLTGADIQRAFQNSGILLEASLASGATTTAGTDMKAALIVLRQVLSTALGEAPSATASPTTQALALTNAATTPASTQAAASGVTPDLLDLINTITGQTTSQNATTASASALVAAVATTAETPAEPSSIQAVIAQLSSAATAATAAKGASAGATAMDTSAVLSALQQAAQLNPQTAALLARAGTDNPILLSLLPAASGTRVGKPDDGGIARTNTPPPPFPGALPAAQPVMPASLDPHMPLDATLRRLLAETDGALARQTLLQVASLPDRADAGATRTDTTQPRWCFEIPFSTPQGTAVAQFEISRDKDEALPGQASSKVWQAKFSLDVEPAGPVHAVVMLKGEKTSVRMWAERPATTMLLRAGAPALTQALARADLVPGDIIVRDGAPTEARAAPAGHFLDRAL
ncbi:flagellar hook-length control protein FliK, partial [Rhodopseudomonas sp. B29]|uniref:flagellar hook-length control protein FliK n=1 Tax=Rhodopseudomonas sp. B29 TaxID=95607 RepID=UPI0003B3F7D2